ncbi:MAG: SIS domain-containing protein [Thermodesulfobacteriota bacterium]
MGVDLVLGSFRESLEAKRGFFTKKNAVLVTRAAELIVDAFKAGGKLLIIGNGGSAADAQHLAAEFVNRFVIERPPLPALALTTDTSALTSIGNDYSFDQVFTKQVRALGKGGDVLLAISTSGGSANVVAAVEAAGDMGIRVIALTGGDGGRLAGMAEVALNVEARATARVQEVHILVCHILCELVDNMLFQEV